MGVDRLSVFEGKWKLRGGRKDRGQAIAISRLVRESGSILGGIRGPRGFLFSFSFILFLKNCFHIQ